MSDLEGQADLFPIPTDPPLREHNRYFPTLAELIQIVDFQFAAWSRPNSKLSKLCST
jgi:hypothetical protein